MMDDTIKVKTTDDSIKVKVNTPGSPFDEPVEEFSTMDFDRDMRSRGGIAGLIGQVGRLYFGVLTLPLNLLPARSRYHAKNSVREGFLTVKTLVDDVNNAIDQSLNRSLERDRVRASMDFDDEIRPARKDSPYMGTNERMGSGI